MAHHLLPTLRSVPLLGWRATVLRLLRDPVLHLLRLQQRYGAIVALGAERGAPVCTFDPTFNRHVLTDTSLFYSLDVTDSAAGVHMPPNTSITRLLAGVTGMNGATHRRYRHMLLPGFQRGRVAQHRDTLVACIEQHLDGWHTGQIIDANHETIELSLSLAIRGLMGLDPAEEGHRIRPLLAQWTTYGLSPQVALAPFNVPGLPYRRFLSIAESLETALRAVIARKRGRELDGNDVLSLLLQAQAEEGSEDLTDDALLGHLTTLFTAGHETTASALSWLLFLLAQHPQVVADLRDELHGALHGAAPQIEQMSQLPLLTGVINEGLRMFPPGMWMLRTTTGPCAIGPYDLSKGTRIVFSPAATHYRPDLYDLPHRFLPRRWETINPSPYEYLPFGSGPRRCLGATFATLELQLILALIVQRFDLRVPDHTRVDRGGTVLSMPAGKLPIRLCPPGHVHSPARVLGNIHDLVNLPA